MAPPRIPAQMRTIDATAEQIRVLHRASGQEFVIQLIGEGRKKVRLEGPHVFQFSVEPRAPIQNCLPKEPPHTP